MKECLLKCEIAMHSVIIAERCFRRSMEVYLLQEGASGQKIRLHELIRFTERDGYRLRLTPDMSGLIADGEDGQPDFILPPFKDVRELLGQSSSREGVCEIPLSPRARGKIQIQEFTFRFWFVAPTNVN